jgi:hypothetical protein
MAEADSRRNARSCECRAGARRSTLDLVILSESGVRSARRFAVNGVEAKALS